MEFKVKVKSGKGEYFKDIEDLYIEFDGKEMKFRDLCEEVEALKVEIRKLQDKLERYADAEAQVDGLLTQTVDLLSKKVARLEVLMKEE